MGTLIKLFNLRICNKCSSNFRNFSNFAYRRPNILQKQPQIAVSFKRTFIGIFKRKTQKQWKIADKIPETYPMIYRNTMSHYIFAAQVIITTTATIACLTVAFKEDRRNMSLPYEKWSKTTKQLDNEIIIFLTSLVAILVAVQVVINRLPLRIYKIPQSPQYIMMMNSIIPGLTKRMICERGKIHHLEESGILPWKTDRYLVETSTERKRIILIDHYFRTPADLSIMLGEQNDPDMYEEIEK